VTEHLAKRKQKSFLSVHYNQLRATDLVSPINEKSPLSFAKLLDARL